MVALIILTKEEILLYVIANNMKVESEYNMQTKASKMSF